MAKIVDHAPLLTVGPAKADIVGATGAAIQTAIDAIATRGGGTVRVLPGTYVLQDAVRLRPDVRLVGDRDRTILKRAPAAFSLLKVDADIGQEEITPVNVKAFRPGMGVCAHDEAEGWGYTDLPLTVAGIAGGVLRLAGMITANRLAENRGFVLNYFPMILGHDSDRAVVDGFTLDGTFRAPKVAAGADLLAKALPDLRTALLHLYHSRDCEIRNIIAKNGLGDGICFSKASVRTLVEDCEAHHNQWYGLHPGSHSAHSAVRRCRIHDNGSDGLYICWGIHHSAFEDNVIVRNGWRMLRSGISIGHKDADNLLARNVVRENAKYGICVRRKTAANSPHRCTYRDNVIENNGSRPDQLVAVKKKLPPDEAVGCGVDVRPNVTNLLFERNLIRETRQGKNATQRHAFRIWPGTARIRLKGNKISGHPGTPVLDLAGPGKAR